MGKPTGFVHFTPIDKTPFLYWLQRQIQWNGDVEGKEGTCVIGEKQGEREVLSRSYQGFQGLCLSSSVFHFSQNSLTSLQAHQKLFSLEVPSQLALPPP